MSKIWIKDDGGNYMNFSDIFKSSFLESVNEFSVIDTCIGMAFALVLGLFIFMIYRFFFLI